MFVCASHFPQVVDDIKKDGIKVPRFGLLRRASFVPRVHVKVMLMEMTLR